MRRIQAVKGIEFHHTLLTSALLRTLSATASGWLFFHGEDMA